MGNFIDYYGGILICVLVIGVLLGLLLKIWGKGLYCIYEYCM